MIDRLVLGWPGTGSALVRFARGAAGSLRLVTNDEGLAETVAGSTIDLTVVDPITLDAAMMDGTYDLVVVATPDTSRNAELARAARSTLPRATIVVYLDSTATSAQRKAAATVADRVVGHAESIADTVISISSSSSAVRAHRIRELLGNLDDDLYVMMHDNPDPDAIASAHALVQIATHFGVNAIPCYFGAIGHQSNRAFVNVLELDGHRLEPDDWEEHRVVALVDHSLPGINDSLPATVVPLMIFDHHAPSGPVEGRYVDLRESVGSTSSIMVEYLRQFELEPDEDLATALLYGIRTDTKNFARKVTTLDFESAAYLVDRADHRVLDQIERPSLSYETVDTLADAIGNRIAQGPIVSSCVGTVTDRDALSQAADMLVQMDRVGVVLVYGVRDGVIFASARARPGMPGIDLATIMREAFGQIGTAGGHEEMAGAQIPIGVLAGTRDPDEPNVDYIRAVIDERFFSVARDWFQVELPVSQ